MGGDVKGEKSKIEEDFLLSQIIKSAIEFQAAYHPGNYDFERGKHRATL